MLIKKESEYAILGLIGMVEENKKFTDVRSIANKKRLSPTLLAKTFQKLVKSNIVGSKFGPNGGFYFKKEPQSINLLEIIETVQGKTKMLSCFSGKAPYCRGRDCPIEKVIKEAEVIVEEYLKGIELKELTQL